MRIALCSRIGLTGARRTGRGVISLPKIEKEGFSFSLSGNHGSGMEGWKDEWDGRLLVC